MLLRRSLSSLLTRTMSTNSAPSSSSSPSLARVVNASEVASTFSTEISSTITSWTQESGRSRPKLVGFLVGNKDSPSGVYADWTKKACEAVGIEYELRTVRDENDEQESVVDSEKKDDDDDNNRNRNNEEAIDVAHKAADLETMILEANSDP